VPSGGAAAAERQGALEPVRIFKSTNNGAFDPKTRNALQSLARRLASPFFLPPALSYYEILAVAKLGKANAACAVADAVRPD
jgi:hypothetical protein